ncbi:MAG TPA: phosphoglycerate kinase [Acidimicrobiales bacterium]|nr:phosphoglycerate kinase [Acidimicrobiales bacterium]
MPAPLPSIDAWGDLSGKRVFVRVDFNAPVAEVNGVLEVTDDFRLRAALPLFATLLERGASVVAATHFGRPNGQVDERYSVEPLRRRLAVLCPEVELIENLRFHPGEEANDPDFGASLVAGFDYYVNEAFGASHRAHASIMVPPTILPSAAGPNLSREVATLLALLDSPERPFIAVTGGAKVKDKLGIMKVLAAKADLVIVGGGMAYTFRVAEGHTIGSSLFDERYVEECRSLLEGGNVLVPVDSRGLPDGAAFGPDGGDDEVVDFGADIPDGYGGLDIGPDTVEIFEAALASARTVLWNGPMGVFEDPRLGRGTEAIARAIAASPAISVVGGGDSVSAVSQYGLADDMSFISTGGGASLELVEFGDLPGLRALRESPWSARG